MADPVRKAGPKRPRPGFNGVVYPQPDKVIDATTGKTLLIDAILNGDTVKIEQLLASGAHPNKTDAEGKSPLHYAAGAGQLEAAKLLLKYKAPVNPRDKKLATPLFEAINSSCPLEMVDCLLKGGADANITNRQGEIPLHLAAQKSGPEVIRHLAQVTDNSGRPNDAAMTPLHYACKDNNLEAVQALIAERVPVLTANNEGETPLHLAAARGHNEIVDYLLTTEAAPLVNAVNMNGKTPLHLAINANNQAMVLHMLKIGADPNMPDSQGVTPLRMASQQWNADPNITLLLIENGADVNSKSSAVDGSALLQAIEMNHTAIARILIEHDADPNATDRYNNTFPLLTAVTRNSSSECVDLLLQAGADPNQRNKAGQTALHMASNYSMSGMVKLLLAKKADPNIADADGRTPLHMIMNRGYMTFEIAHALIDAGANPLQKDTRGVSPYDIAYDGGDRDALALFKKKLSEKGISYSPGRPPKSSSPPPRWY